MAVCRTLGFYAGIGALAALLPFSPLAADDCGDSLCPGFVVAAVNLDKAKDARFDGHRLGDLLTDRLEWHIRHEGMEIALKRATPDPVDRPFAEATGKYSPSVHFDPATRMAQGWRAGVPFPRIDAADPHAADKVAWNVAYGRQIGDSLRAQHVAFLFIDRNGPERKQVWQFARVGLKGLVAPGVAPVRGDGSVLNKTISFAVSPQDVKGLGTLSIRYDTGALDDIWAYLRDVRRIRRLPGSSWMEHSGSSDETGDDFAIFTAYPTWYVGFKILGRRWVLAIANTQDPVWEQSAATLEAEFPRLNLAQAPYWTVRDRWEPREVWVLEGTPPAEHPYGRKVMYVDAENWNIYLGEIYDHDGDYWKTMIDGMRVWRNIADSSRSYVWNQWGHRIDLRKRHASFIGFGSDAEFDAPLKDDDVSLAALEAAGR